MDIYNYLKQSLDFVLYTTNNFRRNTILNYNIYLYHLKKWCKQKTNDYYADYLKSHGSSLYLKYLFTVETEFKLSQLVDHNFETNSSFYEQIAAMIDIHYDFSLKSKLSRTDTYMVNKVKQEFLLYVQQLLTTEDYELPSDFQYERVITGNEADTIISEINSHWKYYNNSYWFPLMEDEPKSVSDKFFIMKKYVAPYWNDICNYISKESSRIYSYGESFYDIKFCVETSTIDNIEHEEWSYTDKHFKWFIYFSHEDTISFAGTIIPYIKKILLNEKEHWDRYEYPEF